MKSILPVLLSFLFLSQGAFADVKIIPSKLQGTAVSLPKNVLQIMEPTIQFSADEVYAIDAAIDSNDLSATLSAVCGMIGKTYVGHSTKTLPSNVTGVISFNSNNEMSLTHRDYIYDSHKVVGILTCK